MEDDSGNLYRRVDEDDSEPPPKSVSKSRKTTPEPVPKKKSLKVTFSEPEVPKQKTPSKKQKSIAEPAAEEVDEVHDEAWMRENTAKDREAKYKKCKRFCKQYERELRKAHRENLEPLMLADALLTEAAATRSRWLGLGKKELTEGAQLQKAVDPLRESGIKSYERAMAIVRNLSAEDAERFWAIQKRNKSATCFDEIKTKKQYKDDNSGSSASVGGVPIGEEESSDEEDQVSSATESAEDTASSQATTTATTQEVVNDVEMESQ